MSRMIFALVLSLASAAAPAASSTNAEYNLGVDAFRAKNYQAARQHWTRAAEHPNGMTYNNLGYLLYYGLGGDKDRMRAVALWRDAAALGEREAQWHLATAYEEGQGTVENMTEAYAWYRCAQHGYAAAAADGDASDTIEKDIDAALARVAARLDDKAKKLAEKLAHLYIRLYSDN